MTRIRQQANCLAVSAYSNAFDGIDPADFVMQPIQAKASDYLNAIPTVYPVLQSVRSNLTTDEYLAMTDAEFDAYIDAQDYGDDE